MPVTMKETIAAAYVALIRRKNPDKVTVKDLVEECGISRQAFYYHFKDIVEVIDWSIERNCEKMLAESLRQPTAAKAIGVYVKAVADNRDLLRRGLTSAKRNDIEKSLFRSLLDYLQTLFRSSRPSIAVNDETEQLALQFCAGGLAGVLLVYCQRETGHQEELSEQIGSFLIAIERVIRGQS